MSQTETQLIMEELKKISSKVDEMYEVFTTGKVGIRIVKWTFALAISVGGAYLMFRNILKP